VETLQRALLSLGARLEVDGLFGPVTKANYQKLAAARDLDTRFDAVTQKLVDANKLKTKPTRAAIVDKRSADTLIAHAKQIEDARARAQRGEALAPLQPTKEPERENRTIAPVTSIPAEVSDRMSVADAQKVLNALGAELEPDGLYGPNTRAAWEAAARNRGLPVRFERIDGRTVRVEPRTRRKLESDATSSSVLPSVASSSSYDPVNAKKQAPTLASHLRRMGKAHYNRDEVKLFQRRAGIKADGVYGPMTREALQHFGASAPPAFYPSSSTAHYAPPAA
jgi:peptidoglycan hydrolase-like protein with peptidoglycan-binding domain